MSSYFDNLDKEAIFAEPPVQELKTNEEEELGFWGTVGDMGMGVVRGVSGAVENTLEIGQVFGLDYDLFDTEDVFGESETMAGSAVEGITQFAAGFIPGMWGLGHLGKIGKVAQTADKFSKTTRTYAKVAGASAIADATVFDAHEERLSNLIQEFPALQNPITEYLASDENDSEIEGRLKNAIEGLGIGFAIDGLLIGLRAMRKGVKHLPDKEAASKATQEEAEKLTREADEVTAEPDAVAAKTDAVEDVKPVEDTPKKIEDIEDGEEMLARMSELSEDELKEIAKDKSINWKTLSEDPDIVKTLRAIGARNMALQEKATEVVTNEQFIKDTIENTEKLKDAGIIAPGDITKAEQITQMAQNEAEGIRRASMFRQFMAEELNLLGGEVGKIADKVVETGDMNAAVEFLFSQKAIERLQFAYKTVSSEFGRGLQAHKVTPGKMPAQLDRGSLEDILADQASRDSWIDSAGGIEKIRAEARKFQMTVLQGNIHKGIGLVHKKATLGGSIIEYWMNAILSGPTTMMVNALSGVLTTSIAPIEKSLGAAFTGNLSMAGRELKRYVYMAESLRDALNVASVSLKDNKAVLDPLTSSVREGQYGPSQITNRMLDTRLANSTMGVEAARWVGNTVNLPSRLLTGTDEFFKQLNYRSAMKAGLAEQAIKNGIEDSRQISKYVNDQFNRLVEDGQYLARKKFSSEARKNPAIKSIEDPHEKAKAIGEYVDAEMKKFSPLADAARQHAREVTFTETLTKDRGHFINISRNISNTVNDSPVLRLVFPFVRTPANIIQYVMERTPVVYQVLNKRHRDAFMDWKKKAHSDSPEIRQEAIGRMMMGTTFLSTGYLMALNGNLTGGGPTDRNQQQILRDAGWQPYSIKVGDNYVSYRRLDPFSSFFGLMADVADAFQNADEMTREEVEGAGMALLISMAKNLTDKTYLTGMTRVSNALSNPDRFAESWFNSTVASFVPNILQQSNRSLESEIKDIRGVLDGIAQKIPGWSDSVAPRRNMLGEPLKYQRAGIPVIDSISPFDYSKTSSDALKKEFSMIGHGFRPPRNVKNGVDLTQFESRSGQSAYDRWLELHGSVKIGGKTLKDSLSRLIRSRSYKKLPYESVEDLDKSPRVNAINRVVAKYRAKAFSQMLSEFPEVQRRDEIGSLIRKNRRSGRDVSQLLALIEDQ
ncbi:MAG: hypothetical protein Tp1125DCM238401_23 [Prokaryotic dsDNA virus sp.]|nr:MAG: hypothetical protein Tp1125DCM238401_23 [Prokaryotic dsDNA virus sp.]|tara:strand:- start:293 stop:3808 length:3516 start_codon:yes stop_codon:yes gene_type:complete